MKILKKLMQFSIILSSFCIISCNGGSTPSPTPTPDPTPTPTPDPEPDPKPEDKLWDHTQDYLRNGKREINFYNLNDTHGIIEASSSEPGIAKIATYLNTEKSKDPDSYVFTSSGDMWQGSADSNLTRGKLMVDWMNYVGCSAQALGNHEFDWSIDAIKENTLLSNFPYLGCNIVYKDTGGAVDFVKPYTTVTANGVHIGIIGAIGEGITSSITSKYVKNLKFDNPYSYVKEYSTYLRNNGADFILFLYHNSTYSISSSLAPYIDGAFGGHNHRTEKTLLEGTIPCIECGSNGKYMSHICASFDFNTSTISYGDCNYNSISTNLAEDSETLAIRAKYADEIDAAKNEKVANLTTTIAGENLITYAEQCMYRYYCNELGGDKPIYRVSHNQTRPPKALYQGIITYGDIYQLFPFDNVICLTTVETRYAKDSYTSYYPLGTTITDDMKSEDGRIYVLSIDYLVTSESYAKYYNIIEAFNDACIREVIKSYLAKDYPLN